jgi:hypothetical protein
MNHMLQNKMWNGPGRVRQHTFATRAGMGERTKISVHHYEEFDLPVRVPWNVYIAAGLEGIELESQLPRSSF